MTKVFNSYAAYYDLLYRDKDYKGESEYILKFFEKYNLFEGSILELGSGTGKHAFHMAHRGFDIQGIDYSESMVEIANSKNKQENISFEVGDVRTYRAGKVFDAVISLFHVASYQSSNLDLQNMFLTAAEHLNPGGLFMFDFWYGPAVLTDTPTSRTKKMSDNKINVLRTAEPKIKYNENLVDVNYTIEVIEKTSGLKSIFSEKHSLRFLFLPELKNLLEFAKIEILESHAWMSENGLSKDSWQGLVIAKKVR
jgi:SAM-dependent methyltransferase